MPNPAILERGGPAGEGMKIGLQLDCRELPVTVSRIASRKNYDSLPYAYKIAMIVIGHQVDIFLSFVWA